MKKSLHLIVFALSALLLGSCATRQKSAAYGWNTNNGKMLDYDQKKEKDEQRMMIYNAAISIEVKNIDTAGAQVIALAKKYDGFVVSTSNNYTTIRVPAASLKNVLESIGNIGKITSKNISGTDVTDEYTDYNIRLENAEKSRTRYLELLAKATTVEEILKVEKELERLNGDIDLLKGKMNRIKHLVDYSTITVHHTQKVKPGIIGYVFVGAYKAVKWLFVRN